MIKSLALISFEVKYLFENVLVIIVSIRGVMSNVHVQCLNYKVPNHFKKTMG